MKVSGAVLCGGRSSRMGRDKATLVVDGEAMAVRAAAALRAGGCDPVAAIGGDPQALGVIGLAVIADDHPGGGPLGGILTALTHADDAVVVVGCDMPWLTGVVIAALRESLGDHDVAVAVGDRREPLCAIWHRRARDAVRLAFDGGERAVHRAMSRLDVAEVVVDPAAVGNVNSPSDLLGRGEHG